MSEKKVDRTCPICLAKIKDDECFKVYKASELKLVWCSKCNRERSDEVKKLLDEKIWGKPKRKT